MSETIDLDPDIKALDDFLMSDDSPPDCMMLCDLDGFLTGIAVGPEVILPSEWLPVIWGSEDPVFETAAQAQLVLGAIMKRYNQILSEVAERVPAPIFMESPGGDIVIAADWAEGFMQAVYLRPRAWEKLIRSEQDYTLPIAALCCDENGGSLLGLDQEVEDGFHENADHLIPQAIIAIADYWRGHPQQQNQYQTKIKIGRNDPCPCASGKKYKKCCGLPN
jgi:uncharacterized protein